MIEASAQGDDRGAVRVTIVLPQAVAPQLSTFQGLCLAFPCVSDRVDSGCFPVGSAFPCIRVPILEHLLNAVVALETFGML